MIVRQLKRNEIEQVWSIDRSERIENIYKLQNGLLTLVPQPIDVRGWPPGEPEKYTPILRECFDRGGWLLGAFDRTNLAGAVVLDNQFIGPNNDQLQLEFLHISSSSRQQGLGRRLFDLAKATARERGARRLYISATPSENTVNFYLRRGCSIAKTPDPVLFAREPEDIHLECEL
ncbi:MAG TPA: GNAT family N-acetyltransferase [Candidatus Binataceae bacterium]|nr:GNAT family N-acetyltransferase [Candidatus Binataceae bacterium]